MTGHDSEALPALRPGLDLTTLKLTPDESAVLVWVDGETSVPDLAHLSQRPEPAVRKILARCAAAGLLAADEDVRAADGGGGPSPSGRSGGASDAVSEDWRHWDADLDLVERERIMRQHAALAERDYFELLGVDRRASRGDVKQAYYEASKQWHPDRYGQKSLGPFRAQLTQIFQATQQAFQTLYDPKKRKAYEAAHPARPTAAGEGDAMEQARRADRERHREEERLRRRRQNNPVRRRMEQARAFYDEAKSLREEGATADALRKAQLAASYDPRAEYQQLSDDLSSEAGAQRAEPLIRRGRRAERLTQYAEAREAYSEAVRFAPSNGSARVRLAYMLLLLGADVEEARKHAHRGMTLAPEDPEAHFVLALCYERAGMGKASVRALQRALELKPNYADAKKKLKRLRWKV